MRYLQRKRYICNSLFLFVLVWLPGVYHFLECLRIGIFALALSEPCFSFKVMSTGCKQPMNHTIQNFFRSITYERPKDHFFHDGGFQNLQAQ